MYSPYILLTVLLVTLPYNPFPFPSPSFLGGSGPTGSITPFSTYGFLYQNIHYSLLSDDIEFAYNLYTSSQSLSVSSRYF